MITQYTNMPDEELIRLAEDSDNELALEIASRIGGIKEEGHQEGYQEGYQEGEEYGRKFSYDEGYQNGVEDGEEQGHADARNELDELLESLCPSCLKLVEGR